MTELQQYIETENAKWVAECQANGAEWYTTTVTDPAHWAEMGVFTVEDYKRHQVVGYISDAHKDAYGFRPRGYDWDAMTMDELNQWADELSEEVAREVERDEARKSKALAEFKSLVQNTIEMGAGDEETALRWLTQSEEFYHSQDVEHWVYNQGILFTDYGRELVNRLLNVVSYKEYDAA